MTSFGSRGAPAERPAQLTTGQAAKLCSVTPDTILKWIKKGRLSAMRTAGGHYRIDRRALESLVVSQPMTAPTSPLCPDVNRSELRCWERLSDRGEIRDNCPIVCFTVKMSRSMTAILPCLPTAPKRGLIW